MLSVVMALVAVNRCVIIVQERMYVSAMMDMNSTMMDLHAEVQTNIIAGEVKRSFSHY